MTPLFPRILNLLGAVMSLPWLLIVGFPQIPGVIASWFSAPTSQVLGIWDIPGIVNYTTNVMFVGTFQVLPVIGSIAVLVISVGQLIKPFAISAMLLSHLIWVKSLVPILASLLFQAFRPEMFAYLDIVLHVVIAPVFAFAALIALKLQKSSDK